MEERFIYNMLDRLTGVISFDKVRSVRQEDPLLQVECFLQYDYGYEHQRIRAMEVLSLDTVVKDYVGNCEYVRANGVVTSERTYLSGPLGVFAVVESQSQPTGRGTYYVHPDHLGSWEKVLEQSKTVVQQTHFDPWGNRMSYAAWNTPQTQTSFTFDRGFTGHEHYDCMHVINANARLYDPVIGRFFSPDPYVQAPEGTQGFNRYSYCMNNPVMYSDPDGENPLLIAAVVYFFFFTDAGYEVQKYISPIAINIDIRFGTHQQCIGYNVSYGTPKLFPYAKRWEQGSSYYWKNYGEYRGYEHRKGSEQSVLGLYHWGETYYESGEFTQTVGKRSFGIPSIFGVDVSNDLWGDGGDRFRTSHQRINLYPFYIGGAIFTGDPGMEDMKTEDEPRATSGKCYIKGPYGDPDKYRHGILYIGAGPLSIGWDCEYNRHVLQNIIGHNWISPETPWFKFKKYKPRLYVQFGWGELW